MSLHPNADGKVQQHLAVATANADSFIHNMYIHGSVIIPAIYIYISTGLYAFSTPGIEAEVLVNIHKLRNETSRMDGV